MDVKKNVLMFEIELPESIQLDEVRDALHAACLGKEDYKENNLVVHTDDPNVVGLVANMIDPISVEDVVFATTNAYTNVLKLISDTLGLKCVTVHKTGESEDAE